MVDDTLILRKVADVETYLDQIEEFRGISPEEYRTDWRQQRIIDRTLHLMMEACLDIAGHLIADARYRVPVSNADAFRVLAENGLLSPDLSTALENMAGFRNLLVHDYERVDPAIVVDVLTRRLVDIRTFTQRVLAHVAGS